MGAGYGTGIRFGYESLYPNLSQLPKFFDAFSRGDVDEILSFMSGSHVSGQTEKLSLQEQVHQDAVRKFQKQEAFKEVQELAQAPERIEARKQKAIQDAPKIADAYANATYDRSIVGSGLNRHDLQKSIDYYENLINQTNARRKVAKQGLSAENQEIAKRLSAQVTQYSNILQQYKDALTFILNNNLSTT